MVLVGPSLGAAVAIDFAVNYPEAVCINSLKSVTTNLKLYPHVKLLQRVILECNKIISG